MIRPRNTLFAQVSQQLETHFGDKVYARWCRNVRLARHELRRGRQCFGDAHRRGAGLPALADEILAQGAPA